MRILNNIKAIQRERHERGMASLMYIFMIVIICASMGVGIDGALGNYTANGLKNAADTAAMSASGKTVFSGNKRAINSKEARKNFTALYGKYRNAYPNVTAKGKAVVNMKIYKSRGSSVNNTFTVTVKEKSATRFLALVGVSEFTYNIESTARLGALYEAL